MTHHPTMTHTPARILLAAVTAMALTLTIACSGHKTPPTDPPDKNQHTHTLEQTIEAVTDELTALQTKTAESQNTSHSGSDRDRRANNAHPTPSNSDQNPQPTTPPPPVVIAPPNGPGICGRSPTIQEAILITLRSPSCQIVTAEELYRIQCFKNIRHECEQPKWLWGQKGPKAGDFAGLVNLQQIGISGKFTIQAGTFTGSAIDHLGLNVKGIEKGAFEGAAIDSMGLTTVGIPIKGTLPTSLTALTIRTKTTQSPMQGDELEHLVNLDQFHLTLYGFKDYNELQEAYKGKDSNEIELTFTLPADILRKNTKLKGIWLKAKNHGANSNHATISLDEWSLDNLTELESLSIEYLKTRNHTSGDPPLTLNSQSPLNDYLYGPRITQNDGSNNHNIQQSDTKHWTQWNYGESIHVKIPDYKPRE